eukprot:gnl/TRDRNA2_/TRDRNA2_55180_c0_seq1.p1 gnl/TRDRNA2_/TRDRNA2_55180_c0~~gnl/TRDRNA2_/TRDRNA2_55180_c0_seq1.p1  ORF type:complete len:169 (-),score=28.46 gnl/TRDRNA2_/TRDRNA2_55180_c0_seq1:196-702(-)
MWSLAVIVLLCTVVIGAGDSSVTAIFGGEDEFHEKLHKASSRLRIVAFFKHACPHCQKFAPSWIKLVDKYAGTDEDEEAEFFEVECEQKGNQDLCQDVVMLGGCDLPCIRHFPPGNGYDRGYKGEPYLGEKEFNPVKKHIKRLLKQFTAERKENRAKEKKAKGKKQDL